MNKLQYTDTLVAYNEPKRTSVANFVCLNTWIMLSLHPELVNHYTILSNVSVFAEINTKLLKQESIGHTSAASRLCSTRINLRDLMTAVDTKK